LLRLIRHVSPVSAVVMMTAFGAPEVVRGAYDLGVHNVISKPFDVQSIEAILLAATLRVRERRLVGH